MLSYYVVFKEGADIVNFFEGRIPYSLIVKIGNNGILLYFELKPVLTVVGFGFSYKDFKSF